MKTRALLLALPLAALAACAQPSVGTVVVTGICGPTSKCAFSGKCDAFVVANPIVDSSVTTLMMLFLQVDNQLPDNSDSGSNRLNTNNAIIESAEIEYSGVLSGKTTVGVNGSVPAAGTAVVGVEVIPGAVGGSLPSAPAYPETADVGAKVRLKGHYADGSSFTTSDFNIFIQVTSGAPQTATCATACPQVGQYPAGC